MTRVLKFVISFIVVLAFAAGGVFGTQLLLSSEEAGSGDVGSGRQPTRVGVTSPQAQTIEDAVSAVGTLRPVRSVELVSNAPGRVTSVPVASGQQVEEGALLIQLDDRATRAALVEAEATLSEARQNFERIEQLADSNVAADASLEQARATLSRAEAAIMTARADLDDRAITAPFAGTLGVIDTEPGSFIQSGVPVTKLSDLSAVEVSLSVPERYYDRVQQGQALFITTPAYPGESFEGRVTLRAPEINLGSRSLEIRAEIDNPDRRLVGGMFANSRLVLDTYQGIGIPDDAIISEGLTTYVYRVEDGNAERTEIEIGTSLGALTEVREGLSADDRVVIAGWDQLSDGAPVVIDENVAREGLE
ncbi:efflux RND transporter periplasmic adaptor subunit [Hoeflea sp. AS60]|uniref:efflux RND transporter periplasmic adaptor subunit n=1 Tax=Hoeflea sp. AS60 TaxID=3135780 RepID=UPI0031708AA1